LVNSYVFIAKAARVCNWFYTCKRPSKLVKVGRKTLTIGKKPMKIGKNHQ
jgi:hypothetical protein